MTYAELLNEYCRLTGYHPDEVVGATEEELRQEIDNMKGDQ